MLMACLNFPSLGNLSLKGASLDSLDFAFMIDHLHKNTAQLVSFPHVEIPWHFRKSFSSVIDFDK